MTFSKAVEYCTYGTQTSTLGLPLYRYSSLLTTALPFATTFMSDAQIGRTVSTNTNQSCTATNIQARAKIEPSLHILIPASEGNDKLCKTLLSSFLLNYPSPTLINFGKIFTGDNWDKGSHEGKIQGVYDYLTQDRRARGTDLVLVIDGFDVWFQLPPEVLVKRYHTIIQNANKRLRQEYGVTRTLNMWKGAQKYYQTVIFGSDKLCWPNSADSPACVNLPASTLPSDAYGTLTDKDPEGFHTRPRYLNSGVIIGPIADMRAIYARALEKVKLGRGAIGDQFIFAEIFGEQEYQRLEGLWRSQGYYRWLMWQLYDRFASPLSLNKTTLPEQRYEFSIGLDYTSTLFQTMTHSLSDISFISDHNGTRPLPTDIQTARPPFPGPYDPTSLAISSLPPYSGSLDILPNTSHLADNILPAWSTVPLATNIIANTTPTLLHVNGDKSILDSWWPRLWYQPHARALLRAYMRAPQPFLWGTVNQIQRTWDRRGGRGGVWTTKGTWLGWGEVCEGVEESVFGDGKGVWGKEEGDGRTWNMWGQQITGEVIEEEGEEDEKKSE